jgi:hypothetical protein
VINQYDQALAMIYQAERTLSEATLDHGFDFALSYRDRIMPLIQQLHQVLSEDSGQIVAVTEDLRTVVYELQRAVFDRNQAEREDWDTWYS